MTKVNNNCRDRKRTNALFKETPVNVLTGMAAGHQAQLNKRPAKVGNIALLMWPL